MILRYYCTFPFSILWSKESSISLTSENHQKVSKISCNVLQMKISCNVLQMKISCNVLQMKISCNFLQMKISCNVLPMRISCYVLHKKMFPVDDVKDQKMKHRWCKIVHSYQQMKKPSKKGNILWLYIDDDMYFYNPCSCNDLLFMYSGERRLNG
jgi:hypothetical protein